MSFRFVLKVTPSQTDTTFTAKAVVTDNGVVTHDIVSNYYNVDAVTKTVLSDHGHKVLTKNGATFLPDGSAIIYTNNEDELNNKLNAIIDDVKVSNNSVRDQYKNKHKVK
jgi:dipeptidyl aminopeptidase/acylaminoacyl peptidase